MMRVSRERGAQLMFRIGFAFLLVATFLTQPAIADSGRSIVLVLDASGSMNAKLPEGATRIDAAKAAVSSLVGGLADDTRLALRVYGHGSPRQDKNCKDSSLVVGFDSVARNRAAVLAKKDGIKAQGYTPINLSLQLAAGDLSAEEAAEHVVLLVSDGKETCEGDPCATAKALAEADAKLVVHTVGFGVDTATRQQLQCIANVARGKYFDATGAGELTGALNKAAQTKAAEQAPKKQIVITTSKPGKLKMEVAGHSGHDVINAAGKKVEELSSVNRVVDVPPGIYSVKFGNGTWTGIEIKAGETTEIKPGYLEVNPMGNDFAYVLEPETGEVVEEIHGAKPRATLMPGRFDVKMGNTLWPGGAELKPGEVTTLKPGVLAIKANGVFYYYLFSPDGTQAAKADVPGHTRVALPPGKYTLSIDPDKWLKQFPDERRKMEIELVEGQELEIAIE
jgi:hypothetical protein